MIDLRNTGWKIEDFDKPTVYHLLSQTVYCRTWFVRQTKSSAKFYDGNNEILTTGIDFLNLSSFTLYLNVPQSSLTSKHVSFPIFGHLRVSLLHLLVYDPRLEDPDLLLVAGGHLGQLVLVLADHALQLRHLHISRVHEVLERHNDDQLITHFQTWVHMLGREAECVLVRGGSLVTPPRSALPPAPEVITVIRWYQWSGDTSDKVIPGIRW